MSGCDKCSKKPVVFIKYSGSHLCRQHFVEFVEKRVRHEIRNQMDLKGGEAVAVAISGGKDSTVALHLVKQILGERRDLRICGITVDEGINGYRESSIPIAADNCRSLGIEHIVISFEKTWGITMDAVAEADRELATCSYCGVLRRTAMNRAAREWGATHLATGLNLDDTAQSIMMNFARGDIERLARLGPHTKIQPGLVPRVQPLRLIPESETTLYAMIKSLRFHDLECPYSSEALRNTYRSVLAQLEDAYPGTRHSILSSYEKILPDLERSNAPTALRPCSCGEPTIAQRCKACELVSSITQKRQ